MGQLHRSAARLPSSFPLPEVYQLLTGTGVDRWHRRPHWPPKGASDSQSLTRGCTQSHSSLGKLREAQTLPAQLAVS